MSSNNDTVVVENPTIMGQTTETVVETPKNKGISTKAGKSHKTDPKASKKVASSKKDVGKGKKGMSYKRGSLNAAINALFDKKGVDEVSYDEAEKLAKAIKPDTKFNRYHLAWYKNNYRNIQE